MNGQLMAVEMAAQPEVLARLAARAPADAAAVRAVLPAPLAGTVFLARGSSDNAAMFGRYLAELHAGRPAGLAAPSLYTRYHAVVDWRGYLVVALSQSGATPEIVSTCRAVRTAGAVVIGITNERGSELAAAADLTLSTDAGPERAVPATKTVTAQFAVLTTVAAALGIAAATSQPDCPDRGPATDGQAGRDRACGPADGSTDAVSSLLRSAADAVAAVLADPLPMRVLADQWRGIDRLVVTGRGLAYAAALETALKVKETTGILAEGISIADLLHGPIAAVYAGAPVLLVDAGGPADADITGLRQLLARRGADLAMLTVPPGLPETVQVVAAIASGQQLARELALARGADPDAPAHLTKVTRTA